MDGFSPKEYVESLKTLFVGKDQEQFYDFILANGREFVTQPFSKKELADIRRMVDFGPKIKECYYNAQRLAGFNEELTYFEGYAIGFLVPVEHAWVSYKGKVLDVTWDGRVEPPHRYFGVEIPSDMILKHWVRTKTSMPLIVELFLGKTGRRTGTETKEEPTWKRK